MEKRDVTPKIRDTLFSLIRNGLAIDSEPVDLAEEDCATLISIGEKQSIQMILYYGLKRSGAPKNTIQPFDDARLRETYSVIQQTEALRNIIATLEKEKLPYVLLKGAVLRSLYPIPELRTSSDIDVLVQEKDLSKTVQILESQTDFKMVKRLYHDVSMVSPSVHLELHFNIKEDTENIDRVLSHAWDYAEPVGNTSCYAFTPEFQVFHVIAHMSYHFLHGGLGIRPFLDLWLLKHKLVFDEDEVRQMCLKCDNLTFYEECCNLSEVWLGKKEHNETTKMLESFCLTGGVFGSSCFRNAGRQRKKRGWKFILSRILPPATQVREYYRDETGKTHSLLYYYVKRLLSWFSKKRRAELRKQVSGILSSDKKYLDSTDELFRRLEL